MRRPANESLELTSALSDCGRTIRLQLNFRRLGEASRQVGGRMIPMLAGGFAQYVERARHLLPVVVTLALAALLVATLAFTYFGHSRSPYDTCYGMNGRAVSCSVLEAVR